MQNIEKSELLGKLTEGWEVRRKKWGKGLFVHLPDDGCLFSFLKEDLLANDWEGRHPLDCDYVITHDHLNLAQVLFDTRGARHTRYRHRIWPKEQFVEWCHETKKFQLIGIEPYRVLNKDLVFSGGDFNDSGFELWEKKIT